MKLEQVAECPICQSSTLEPFLQTVDYSISGEFFNLIACNNCQLKITSPRPSEINIGKYYQSKQYISHNNSANSFQDQVYKLVRSYTLRKKVSQIESYHKSGTILDIGCGTGLFLNSFKKENWHTYGIEPSATAAQQIPKHIIVQQKIEDLHIQADVITLWHVLEHVHRLQQTMKMINERLTPNGHLFIAVPNPESYDARKYKNFWAAYDTPRHLWHFPKESITKLLSQNGFKLVDIKPLAFDSYYVSLLSEKYKSPTRTKVNQYFNALITGALSNLKAGKTNYSSLLYIATR